MIKREQYMEKIRPFIDKEIIKVLTGIRRCGKSVMLKLIQEELISRGINKEQILDINFESRAVDYVTSVDKTYNMIKHKAKEIDKKLYLFFDEIQELQEWETMINSIMIDFDVDIYITGSNAKMLSGELATYLAGRYVEIKIYPFSFREVTQIFSNKTLQEVFQIYLIRGGMPFLYQFPLDSNSSKQYLEDIYSSIILKDIAQRNKIRDIELFKRVMLYMLSNVGNVFSSGNITKYLKNKKRSLSTETIYNYIEYSKSACLIHMVSREDIIGKKSLQFQEKVYVADHGLREAIYGNNTRDINQILENIVYMELLRRGYEVTIGKVDCNEIDFVGKKGSEKIYIQVSYLLASEETIEREFGVLEKVPDNYPKYVISMDEIDRGRNGIKHLNITKFLTMGEY